jgi:NitT/TauT family transport system substrate-binding protein
MSTPRNLSLRWLAAGMCALLAACGGAAAPASSPAATGAASASAAAKPATSGAASASAKPAGSAGASAAASGSPAPIPTAKPGQIIMAYSEVVGVHAPEWAAAEDGTFTKNGLNVDVRLIESSLGVGAVVSGQVQIASMGGSEALAADVNGADLVAYATLSPIYPYIFEVLPSIKTPEDLKGRKIGISRFGSSSDTATRVYLKSVGLDPAKDVSFVQIGSLQARTAALKTGQLDGAMASPPDAAELEAGGLHPLANLAELKLPAVNDCVIASRAWVNANHDTFQKFIDSVMTEIPKVKSDRNFTYDVFRKYLKEDNPDKLKIDYDFYVQTSLPNQPYPTTDGFKDAVTTLAAQNPKVTSFDLNKIVDQSFIKSAVDRGLDKAK